MADITILHNPRCSTSRAALAAIDSAGLSAEVITYLTHPLDAVALSELIDILEDPATDLVRRDSTFAGLGLTETDVATREQVLAVLVEHPRLMQRPVLIRGGRAVIGRPRQRSAAFIAG